MIFGGELQILKDGSRRTKINCKTCNKFYYEPLSSLDSLQRQINCSKCRGYL